MRCYDGCWDDEAQALFKEQDRLLRAINCIEPEARCTYFPMEQTFQVHVWGRELSAMCSSKMAALNNALQRLRA